MRRIAIVAALVLAACDPAGSSTAGTNGPLGVGRVLYQVNCSACHGVDGLGTASGPALIDPSKGPDQTPDSAFVIAVTEGVDKDGAFTAMAPVEGLSHGDIQQITNYVRELQRGNGIG
jgi:mono/diheme cytochrome c family protein